MGPADAYGRGTSQRRLLATLGVTLTIMVAEVTGGLLSGSLALLADAGHMLTDLLALLVAFAALALGSRPADGRRTYGYRRLEILAALINGVALVVLSGSIFYEAFDRWLTPQHIDIPVMATVAAIALLANLVGLWLLNVNRDNLNMRAAFLHVLGDTLSSVGVLGGAGLIALTGWTRLDAIISGLIGIIIVVTSLRLLHEVFEVLIEAAPASIDTDQVRRTIGSVSGVGEVHDLHVWSITSGMPALSAHVVLDDRRRDTDAVLVDIQHQLKDRYAIEHSTLQIEQRAREDCGCC